MLEEENKEFNPELPEGLQNEIDQNNNNLTELSDGTQILKGYDDLVDEEREEISNSDLKKLVAFTTPNKNPTEEELDALKKNDEELERLIRISMIKSKSFNYSPKKNFGVKYKAERKRKNKVARVSRQVNRR